MTPSEADTPTPTAEPAPTDPCEFAPAGALTKALRKHLGGGELVIDTAPDASYSDQDKVVCMLTLPDTHQLEADGQPADTEFRSQLWIQRFRYDTNQTFGLDCEFGGTTPSDVFTSVLACRQADAAQDGRWGPPISKPKGAGGIVIADFNEAAVAGPGDYWYEVRLTNMPPAPAQAKALEAAAKVLLAQE